MAEVFIFCWTGDYQIAIWGIIDGEEKDTVPI